MSLASFLMRALMILPLTVGAAAVVHATTEDEDEDDFLLLDDRPHAATELLRLGLQRSGGFHIVRKNNYP